MLQTILSEGRSDIDQDQTMLRKDSDQILVTFDTTKHTKTLHTGFSPKKSMEKKKEESK